MTSDIPRPKTARHTLHVLYDWLVARLQNGECSCDFKNASFPYVKFDNHKESLWLWLSLFTFEIAYDVLKLYCLPPKGLLRSCPYGGKTVRDITSCSDIPGQIWGAVFGGIKQLSTLMSILTLVQFVMEILIMVIKKGVLHFP